MKNRYKIILFCVFVIFVSGFYYSWQKSPRYIDYTFYPSFSNAEVAALGSKNSVVIFQSFTNTAYGKNAFYTYFRGECDESCLTVKVDHQRRWLAGYEVLKRLEYNFVNDEDLAIDPGLIDQYDTVIVLHNEYVTREMFEAITNHKNVIYLYPNSLYAQVKYDNKTDSITLVRGHNYPEKEISNGFDWEFDNSLFEYDQDCADWKFYEIDNGVMLNCYPEDLILHDRDLLREIKKFS